MLACLTVLARLMVSGYIRLVLRMREWSSIFGFA